MKGKILGCLLIILLLILAIPIGCNGSAQNETEPPTEEELREQGFLLPELPRITCEQLKQIMDEEENFVLVDTRTPIMYDLKHLPGSINIPIESEETAITKLQALPKDRLIVFYCD